MKLFILPLDSIKNITLKYLPPYSSELNSIDHLLKDIRMNVTLFESIDQVQIFV